MISIALIVFAIFLAVYLLLGFRFLSNRTFIVPRTASLFNSRKKNIYASSLEEKMKKEVVTREQYEWIQSERHSTPLSGHLPN